MKAHMNHERASGRLLWTALLLGCPSLLYSQSATTGALAGTVRDSAGAPLPDSQITLIDVASNQSLTSRSGPDGAYHFPLLVPGTYEARFASLGFKTARMPAVVVSVSEAPVLDAELESGEPSDEMECRCRISTVTSSTGVLVDAKTITAVPLTTRNFTQVLSMSSGSAADVNNAGTLGRGTRSYNVNGNTSAGAYSLDGSFAPSAVPNPDTISELKIHTSQYDAIYGAQVPSTSLITKSGEKDFHGDAWEFIRNNIFNANSFFLNSTGQPKADLKQNQFGATLGGPVLRQKLFFFTSYQGTRQVNGLDTTSTSNPILPPLTNDRSASALAAEFCPANHPNDVPLSLLRRRQTVGLPQSIDIYYRADQPGGPSPSSIEKSRTAPITSLIRKPSSRVVRMPGSASPPIVRRRFTTRTRRWSTPTICSRPRTRSPRAAISPPSISSAPLARRRAIPARRWSPVRERRKHSTPGITWPA